MTTRNVDHQITWFLLPKINSIYITNRHTPMSYGLLWTPMYPRRFKIKTISYRLKNFQYKPKMVSRLIKIGTLNLHTCFVYWNRDWVRPVDGSEMCSKEIYTRFCCVVFALPSYDWYRMMTSSNVNIFRVTGHLCGEFTGPQWRGALMFSLICVWINGWVSNREAGDLRRYRAHFDVTAMGCFTGSGTTMRSPLEPILLMLFNFNPSISNG